VSQLMWYGYLHQSGTLHVKRYFGRLDIRETKESPFVQSVHGPWPVGSRDEAFKELNAALNNKPKSQSKSFI